jgi:hypothetical protein
MHCALLALPAFWQASMLAYLQVSVPSVCRQNFDLPTTLLINGFGEPTGATWLCEFCAFAIDMLLISAPAAIKVVNVLMSLLLETIRAAAVGTWNNEGPLNHVPGALL